MNNFANIVGIDEMDNINSVINSNSDVNNTDQNMNPNITDVLSTSINFIGHFENKISNDISTDPNIYENTGSSHESNINLFNNLYKLYKDEQDRIFETFNENKEIINITDKISCDMKNVNLEYNPDKFLKDLQSKSDEEEHKIINILNDKLNLNINSITDNIKKIKIYYKELFIETHKLENKIINILKKYDNQFKNINDIYKHLYELDDMGSDHLNKIDREFKVYAMNYFKKVNLQTKLEIYKKNIDIINVLKKQINKIHSINFIPYCNICMTNIVDVFIIPCGHTICSECLKKSEKKCFVCRCTVEQTKKLYIN